MLTRLEDSFLLLWCERELHSIIIIVRKGWILFVSISMHPIPSIDLMITSPTISKEMNKQKMSLISDFTSANARRKSI